MIDKLSKLPNLKNCKTATQKKNTSVSQKLEQLCSSVITFMILLGRPFVAIITDPMNTENFNLFNSLEQYWCTNLVLKSVDRYVYNRYKKIVEQHT